MKLFATQSKTDTFADELEDWFVSSSVRLRRGAEGQWRIDVGADWTIRTNQWRLIGAKSIVVTSEDDGHQLGLPAPIDAEAKANETADGLRISAVSLDARTGDLTISFDNGFSLQVHTWSSAFETWQLYRNGEFYGAVGNEGLR
ncbi:MAG: hypothetical protein ACMUJI_07505 [Erythrobacter sp.]|uniref:hypothetical protein n=1 Tax=Erythrobacter sp. TaxID=1042 RepID=UPI003A856418